MKNCVCCNDEQTKISKIVQKCPNCPPLMAIVCSHSPTSKLLFLKLALFIGSHLSGSNDVETHFSSISRQAPLITRSLTTCVVRARSFPVRGKAQETILVLSKFFFFFFLWLSPSTFMRSDTSGPLLCF